MASGLVSCHAFVWETGPRGLKIVVGMLVGGVGLEFPALVPACWFVELGTDTACGPLVVLRLLFIPWWVGSEHRGFYSWCIPIGW